MKLGIFIQNRFSDWVLDLSYVFGLSSKFTGMTIGILVFIRTGITGKALEELKNHERIHIIQYFEVTAIFMVLFTSLSLWLHLHQLIPLLSFLMYYVIYIKNFLLLRVKSNSLFAYRRILFEKEAYDNDTNPNYLQERKIIAWINA